jgi:hypothetical protein
VHGTPVLDIKPYLPYADSVAGATVPHWVVESPVPSLGAVTVTDAAMQQMLAGKFDFFSGGEEFALALKQVRPVCLTSALSSPALSSPALSSPALTAPCAESLTLHTSCCQALVTYAARTCAAAKSGRNKPIALHLTTTK